MIPFPYQLAGAGLVGEGVLAAAGQHWNPADKHPGVTLSDSDKLATKDTNFWGALRSVQSHSSGRRYAEIVYSSGPNWAVIGGVATAAHDLTRFPGESAASFGLQCDGGGFAGAYHSGSVIGTVVPGIAVGGIIRVACDFDAGKLWLGTPSAFVGGGNPAIGSSPTAIFAVGTTYFLALGLYTAAGKVRTGAVDLSGSLPAGFSAWAG